MPNTTKGLRVPAAERLAGALLGRIERGEYAPGEWLPTERELATEFRADRSTIRTALSSLADKQLIVRETGRRPRVSDRAEARVGSGHEDGAARTPLQTLAVLSPQTPHYLASPAIQRGVLQVLSHKEAPYRLIVFDNGAETRAETVRRERLALESIRNEGISGVVIWHQGSVHTLPDLRLLQEAGVPMVLVDRCDPSLTCDFVGIDNVAASREAVSHLLDLGHTRIMHLTIEDPTITVRDREQGYRQAMRTRGVEIGPEWIFRMSNATHLQPPAAKVVDHILSLPEPPTAVFAMNDLIAHDFMSELQARGVRVPEDISVMGFDDMDRHSRRPSPLTTVHQPFEQMGEKAVELLLSRLSQPSTAPAACRHILLPTRLVIRTSCIPLAP